MDLEDCNSITDVTLQHLNHGCPNLSSLALSHCELLTDNGLAEFCASHKECIQVLELDNCPLITDATLDYMKPLKNLERVDLYDCALITKEAIKRFKVKNIFWFFEIYHFIAIPTRSRSSSIFCTRHTTCTESTRSKTNLSLLCNLVNTTYLKFFPHVSRLQKNFAKNSIFHVKKTWVKKI